MRTYAPYSESIPTNDARPIRVVLHTADGWVHVGDYATHRGADRAHSNAVGALGYLPECARIGGTDSVYAMRWNTQTHTERWDRPHTDAHGCADVDWFRRRR